MKERVRTGRESKLLGIKEKQKMLKEWGEMVRSEWKGKRNNKNLEKRGKAGRGEGQGKKEEERKKRNKNLENEEKTKVRNN